MPFLSRERFVAICNDAIFCTREKIDIANQLSGYKKYHREIKDNNYFFFQVRNHFKEISADEHVKKHEFIGHVGLGMCRELAEYLLVEIAREISRSQAIANVLLVRSLSVDHTYLRIRIYLAGEKDFSEWEVDAWDPRIIDITSRPDGTIKNEESLVYGTKCKVLQAMYSDEINHRKEPYRFDFIPKPKPGASRREPTPEREMLVKNSNLYSDYNMADAIENGKIDSSGSIHYLQKSSNWQ